jgi:hypothetical protein
VTTSGRVGRIPSSSDTASLSESARTTMEICQYIFSMYLSRHAGSAGCRVAKEQTTTHQVHIDCPWTGLGSVSIEVILLRSWFARTSASA